MRTRVLAVMLCLVSLWTGAHWRVLAGDDLSAVTGPKDLTLHFKSSADGTQQPYRIFLPSAYDGKKRLPLLVAMHGTTGNHNTYFDEPRYGNGNYKTEADKRGIIVLCPDGRGASEYRGLGEHNVLATLEDACNRFLVDTDRIVCSGQSMGGTATTYFCCRYPDLFAGGIPLGSTYGHLSLLENLRHVPLLYVQGAKDWRVYAQDGPIPITRRLQELKFDVEYWSVKDQGHATHSVSTPRVMDWALQRQLARHPKQVTFNAYLPHYGRAYWTEIAAMVEPGPLAKIDAQIKDGNRIDVAQTNVRRLILRPDAALLALDQPLTVWIDGQQIFQGACTGQQQLRLDLAEKTWNTTVEPRKIRPYTAYRTQKIGTCVKAPSFEGDGETSMGSFNTDVWREATGVDIAIDTRRVTRGVKLVDGQEICFEDLLHTWQPINQVLVRFKLTGRELLDILDDSVEKNKKEYDWLVQVSGCRYTFDRSRARGERIVESDIDPQKTYSIVCNPCLLTRGDMLKLRDRVNKIPYEWLDMTNVSAIWRHLEKNGGKLEAKTDGRIRDATKK